MDPMVICAAVAILASAVATYARHRAQTWTPPNHTLARRLANSHSVR